MRKPCCSKFSIFLNVILILLLAIYFIAPFLNSGILTKVYSPLCRIIDRFQGESYLPPWCEDILTLQAADKNENSNQNTNFNQNVNGVNDTNTNQNVGIANPAAVKCLQDGGSLENYQSAGGEAAICIFNDKSICDEWKYFREECKVGECFKICDAIGTFSEGWYNSCTKEKIKYEKCSGAITDEIEQSNIKVSTPVANQQLSSPFKVEGQAKVFENQVNIRVKGKDGKILIQETAIVKSPEVGEWGDFSIEVNYDFNLTKEGFVEVYSTSARDGSAENLVSVPVKF